MAIGLAGENGEDVLEHVSGSPFGFAIAEDGHVAAKPSEHTKHQEKAHPVEKPHVPEPEPEPPKKSKYYSHLNLTSPSYTIFSCSYAFSQEVYC